jgi:hypothetical protein
MLTPELALRAADVLTRARSLITSMESRYAGTGVQHHHGQLHGEMFKTIYELEQAAEQPEKEGNAS